MTPRLFQLVEQCGTSVDECDGPLGKDRQKDRQNWYSIMNNYFVVHRPDHALSIKIIIKY